MPGGIPSATTTGTAVPVATHKNDAVGIVALEVWGVLVGVVGTGLAML